MKENIIQLKESDVIKLKIRTNEGVETGDFLSFNLGSIDWMDKLNEMKEKDKKNKNKLKEKLHIIEKRKDVNNKKSLNKYQLERAEILKEFLIEEEKVYNIFLGENGVKKLLNGEELTWYSLIDIDEIIEKQIYPYLKKSAEKLEEKIKKKYAGIDIDINSEVLK